MNEIFALTGEMLSSVFESRFFSLGLKILLVVLLFSLPARFFRFLLDIDSFSFSFDLPFSLKDKFIDLLKKLFGFEFIKKLGLARPGVDYVECNIQDCDSCPFRFMGTCPPERQAKFKNMKD